MNIQVNLATTFHTRPELPADKSLSHRSLILASISQGTSQLKNLLHSEDIHSTEQCLRRLGVTIETDRENTLVYGRGLLGLRPPQDPLPCGNSGTTMRLLMGLLCGFPFPVTLQGDASLEKRPMGRIAHPLSQMGATFSLTNGNFAPLKMRGQRPLTPIHFELPIASAQLKSALLLAGLVAPGTTTLTGKIHSRDHTERLLKHLGVPLSITPSQISIDGSDYETGRSHLPALSWTIPGDPSSAAYWIAAAILIAGTRLELTNLLLNPTRLGFIQVLKRMGANIETEILSYSPEPVGTIRVQSSHLRGTTVQNHEIPSLIDELPLLGVLATFAEGETKVTGASELRVKESDRIDSLATNLRRLGGKIDAFEDGFSIEGPQKLSSGSIDSFGDHRIALAFAVAGLRIPGPTEIRGADCVDISYPGFFETLKKVMS